MSTPLRNAPDIGESFHRTAAVERARGGLASEQLEMIALPVQVTDVRPLLAFHVLGEGRVAVRRGDRLVIETRVCVDAGRTLVVRVDRDTVVHPWSEGTPPAGADRNTESAHDPNNGEVLGVVVGVMRRHGFAPPLRGATERGDARPAKRRERQRGQLPLRLTDIVGSTGPDRPARAVQTGDPRVPDRTALGPQRVEMLRQTLRCVAETYRTTAHPRLRRALRDEARALRAAIDRETVSRTPTSIESVAASN